MERTVVILKPDAMERHYMGRIITRLEEKGLELVGCKMILLTQEVLDVHYRHLRDRPFFARICKFMLRRPVIVQCWEGLEAVTVVRRIVGVTNAREAMPGTIRGDWAMSVQCNLVHASDTLEAAREEISRFFEHHEVFGVDVGRGDCLYNSEERGQ